MERTIQKTIPVADDSWVTIDVYGDPDAPGIVVVPGAMSDAHTWRHVATALDAWPSVSVVNRRGRTPSGPLTAAYTLHAEVADLNTVLDQLPSPSALFGWSYGGLIALLATNDRPVPHLIAYEPVMRPFAADVLPALKAATDAGDWDGVVALVNQRVSGFDAAHVEALRADAPTWSALRELGKPAHAELAALNAVDLPGELALRASRVDLVVGERNQGRAPYGTSFDDVRRHVTARAGIHVLPGQGHLAHIEDPAGLGSLVSGLVR
ncbi:alpha/beta hydrolase [Streptomyces sp. NPDC001941]|uniref:alpha/beta fold hydrolase n=1 Tax=Streptomyces sp. NPDC001941 TaxID=3154659 RepID=UPI00333238FF